ncbi:MAG: HAD family phosphatase, partial [Actinobacteria bacterium]|nr:HAD family phosphatase [Actinomycetota bacterium]
MRYKAVIADVDGTLVPPSELPAPRPSSRLIEVVEKVIKKGVVFSLATARSLGWVKEVIEALKLNSLVILDNGARIYDCGNKCYLWESFLDREDVERVFSVLKNEKPLRIFLAEGEKRLD